MNSGLRGCGTSECRHVLCQDSGSAHVLLFITLQQGGYTCWAGAVYITSIPGILSCERHIAKHLRCRSRLPPPPPPPPPALPPPLRDSGHRSQCTHAFRSNLTIALQDNHLEMIASSSETLRAGNICTKRRSRVCTNTHALTHRFSICHISTCLSRNSSQATAYCRFSPLLIAELLPGLPHACV